MKIISLIALPLLFISCANLPQDIPSNIEGYNNQMLSKQDAPAWVLKGNGAFSDDNFYGVGSASGINDPSVLRQVADDRARNDLIKLLALDSASLLKDYQSSTIGNDESGKKQNQTIESAILSLTHATLAGVVIIDHWEHPKRNEFFSLARLDVDKFEAALEQVKALNTKVHEAILKRTAELNEQLENEIREKEERLSVLEEKIDEAKQAELELEELEEDDDDYDIDYSTLFEYAKFIGLIGLAIAGGGSPQ